MSGIFFHKGTGLFGFIETRVVNDVIVQEPRAGSGQNEKGSRHSLFEAQFQ